MNWLEAVDGYCERVDASVWSEPLNATTNITFLIASVWILRKDGLNGLSRTLAYLLGAIGCASFLFHTLAQAWTGALDVVFILFFTLLYLFAATKDFFGSKISTALAVLLDIYLFVACGLVNLTSKFYWVNSNLRTDTNSYFIIRGPAFQKVARCVAWPENRGVYFNDIYVNAGFRSSVLSGRPNRHTLFMAHSQCNNASLDD